MRRLRPSCRSVGAVCSGAQWPAAAAVVARRNSAAALPATLRQERTCVNTLGSRQTRTFGPLASSRRSNSHGQGHQHTEEFAHGAHDTEQPADDDEAKSKSVVLSKRLPEDYVENTLMPHLEAQLLESIHVYTPAELAKISRAYSVQKNRQWALVNKLSEQIQDRMVAFEAVDIVDIISPMWTLQPGDDDLWEAFEQRIMLKIDDFTALNLIGLLRIFNKREGQHPDLMSKAMPRLQNLLKDYEAVELTEMLMSIAQSHEAAQDMDILLVLVPEIERRYNEVSLVHAINNIWALTRLKVVHQPLLTRVAKDLSSPTKTKDLTPAYMSRIVWVYRRCKAWDEIKDHLLPLIKGSAAEFRCGEFARLAQALPEERALLQRISDLLRLGLAEMGRKDFMLFFLACVHGEILEAVRDPPATDDPDSLLFHCLSYIREEQDNFKREEVEKIVYLLKYAPKYQHLLDDLPVSWKATKEEVLGYILAKG